MQNDMRRSNDPPMMGAYVPGPLGSSQGERAVQELERNSAYSNRRRQVRMFARSLRAYYHHDTYLELVKEVEPLEKYIEGDFHALDEVLVKRENTISSMKPAARPALMRRRYQGTDYIESAAPKLSVVDWESIPEGSPDEAQGSAIRHNSHC